MPMEQGLGLLVVGRGSRQHGVVVVSLRIVMILGAVLHSCGLGVQLVGEHQAYLQ